MAPSDLREEVGQPRAAREHEGVGLEAAAVVERDAIEGSARCGGGRRHAGGDDLAALALERLDGGDHRGAGEQGAAFGLEQGPGDAGRVHDRHARRELVPRPPLDRDAQRLERGQRLGLERLGIVGEPDHAGFDEQLLARFTLQLAPLAEGLALPDRVVAVGPVAAPGDPRDVAGRAQLVARPVAVDERDLVAGASQPAGGPRPHDPGPDDDHAHRADRTGFVRRRCRQGAVRWGEGWPVVRMVGSVGTMRRGRRPDRLRHSRRRSG